VAETRIKTAAVAANFRFIGSAGNPADVGPEPVLNLAPRKEKQNLSGSTGTELVFARVQEQRLD
jgi:hypothetical protein